ncbi:MAG TPA: oligosaccharide flippase family protein, partial [Candidatus Gracilibacteria bacterium]|nr:oligosaccharide flippase family protein [Candidatus Gracilibacteria bacterium]
MAETHEHMKETAAVNPTLGLLGRKIAFSTIVQYAGKGLQLVLSALTLKLISNFLSEHDYGLYAAIAEYALFFSVAANLGIFAHTIRKMADAPGDGKIFFHAFFLRVSTAFGFAAIATMYLLLTSADGAFLIGASLFLGALVLDYVTSVCDAMLQANYMMGRATIALVAGRVVNFGVVWLLVSGVAPVELFFLAPLLGGVLTAGMSLFFVRQKLKWSWRIDRLFLKRFFLAGLPFGIINIINNLYFRFLPDYFAHGALTTEQFGSFNIFFRVGQVISLLSTFLM